MTTYALTVSTDDLGLGVIDGARVIAVRRRAIAADQYPPIDALYRIESATNSLGVATISLKPDDTSTYHTVSVIDTDGVVAHDEQIMMPPSACDLHDVPAPPTGTASIIQFKVSGENKGTPTTARNVNITGNAVESGVFSTDTLTITITKPTTPGEVGADPAGTAASLPKLTEIKSRADLDDGAVRELLRFQAGGVTSDSILTNPTFNQIRANSSATAIMGGGSSTDPHLIGLGFPRASLEAIGSDLVFSHEVADTSKLRVRKHSSTNVQTALTLTTDYTVVVGSGITTVTLNTPLIANERCYAEDAGLIEDKGGTTPSYCGIGPAGYDNQIHSNVMHLVNGAHHRVLSGDHGTIYGGSYGTIRGGSYSAIVGGTQNEIGASAGNGSGVFAGLRNRATGAGSWCLGGQECEAGASYAATIGGYRLKITGTASAGTGRENTCNSSDSFFWGRGNTSTGNYSFIGGYLNTIGSGHAHSRVDGGYRLTTTWTGETIHWGYRDTENSNTPYIAHKTVYLRKYTAGTTAEKITTIDGATDTFTPPSGYIWACELYVTARTGALRGGAWKIEYVVQNVSGTVTILGSPTVVALGQDAQLGTAGNEATITVGVVSNAVEINVQPRLDTAVSAKWCGFLEIREVS